jgi:hypothetical protein
MANGAVLDRRRLNRALLDRQLMLHRQRMSAAAAVEHLVGLQAQAPGPPYVALWGRLEGFDPDELGRLLTDRSAVRATLMRGTIHLVTTRDALAVRPLVQPMLECAVYTNATFGRHRLDGVDVDELLAAGRALVEERPRTVAELRELLGPRWPDRDPAALAQAVRGLVPMVHVPPRGVWGHSGPVALTTFEAWLGRGVDTTSTPPTGWPEEMDTLVLRYLAAFGPAAVADVQTWSGLTRLGPVFERLRPRLRMFKDEHDRTLYDLPDAPRPEADTPAPVRFLAEFDNLTLSHAERSRVISEEHRRRIAARNGMVPGTVLVDGFVQGTWRLERGRQRGRRSARLRVDPFARLNKRDRAAVVAEGAALLEFAAPDASSTEVEIS